MRVIQCSSIPNAYEKGIKYVLDNGKQKHVHNTDVKQANEVALEIKISNELLESKIAPFGFESNQSYIDDFLNPDKGEFTYTYGERICNFEGTNQFDEVISKIKSDPDNRQSIIVIWNPKTDNQMKDCPCLQHIHFYLDADNKFTMKVLFRSNDFYGALYSNMVALYHVFKLIGEKTGLTPEKYIHEANCPHIYWYNIKECESKLGY